MHSSSKHSSKDVANPAGKVLQSKPPISIKTKSSRQKLQSRSKSRGSSKEVQGEFRIEQYSSKDEQKASDMQSPLVISSIKLS